MTKNLTNFKHLFTVTLESADEIALLGAAPGGALHAESFAEAGDVVIRWRVSADGQEIQRLPEESAAFAELPPGLTAPQTLPPGHPWDFSGARLRGLREEDRVSTLVQPLTIMQKMPLISHLGLAITPMQLLGVAESRLLAAATFPAGDGVLCRRVRLAYALATVQHDDDGLPYDYDTIPLYLLHAYKPDADEPPPLEDSLSDLAGVAIPRPMDCLYYEGRLIVADAGLPGEASRVLVFEHVMT